MAGAAMNPVQTTGPVDVSTSRTPSPSYFTTVRITDAVNRLRTFHRDGSTKNIPEICRLGVSLSRGIDYAVANNEIPDKASELPSLFQQVCQWRNNTFVLTMTMVLMISMKGACRRGWFSEKDNEELHTLWNEIAPAFCSPGDLNPKESRHCISTVMSRFYPRMKIGGILAVIETMPGYGVFVKDFHAATKDKSPDEEVYLFVAQMDNTETSSCITSPQLVNFLLNGKAVDRRTCLHTDHGPQIPTLVMDLVKHGTNLLQAVGQFNGKYVIAVAFMSVISNPSCPVLDYTPPVRAASDSDNDIVEGSSRISLNCPISFTRIVTPVKGHLCKHLQCFDFENYVDINSRRPSWRCPHCSQSVCFTDLRVDQAMAKVLKEVAGDVSHVKISADGSLEAVGESDDHADKQQDKSLSHQQSTARSDLGEDIMDLTGGDNDIDAGQENDKKPPLIQLKNQLNPSNVTTNHVHTPYTENQFFNPTNVTVHPSQTVTSGSNYIQFQPHAVRPSIAVMNPILQGQNASQIAASSMQFQQPSMSMLSNDLEVRFMPHSRSVTRVPIAVGALPVQTPAGKCSDDRQQQFSSPRFQMDQLQMMNMSSQQQFSSPRFQMDQLQMMNMGTQDWVRQDLFNVSSQQFGERPGPSPASSHHHFNTNHHQPSHIIPSIAQSPSYLYPQAHLGFVDPTIGPVSYQQAHNCANAVSPRTFQVSGWTPPVPTPVQTPAVPVPDQTPPVPAPVQTPPMSMTSLEEQRGFGQALRVQDGAGNASVEQNWRPTGRMRGSLSGQAYSDAFNQLIVPPTQPVQAATPPALNTPRPVIPPHLQPLLGSVNAFLDGR